MKNTRKNIKNTRNKKSRTLKNIRGGQEVPNITQNLEQKSLEELQMIKDERAEKSRKAMEDATNLAKGITVNTLEKISKVVGVDLANPEETTRKLDNIKRTFSDPKNFEKIRQIIYEAAKKGALMFEAAKPLIDPFVDKAIKVGSKSAIKIADTSATIFTNLLKEIPGLGLVFSLVQDATKIGEAASAVTNAAAELTTQTADSSIVFKKNLDQLKKEGADTESRVDKSLNEFTNPEINPQVPLQTAGKKYTRKSNLKRKKLYFLNN